MKELIKNINSLWAGKIKSMEFPLLKHTIFLEIEVIEDGRDLSFNVLFEGVSSYFYLNDEGSERLKIDPYEETDYLELTSIHYIREGIGHIGIESQTESWTNNWFASANFVLEMWNAYLFIEAKSLSINGIKFEVGYPTKEGGVSK